MKEPLPETAEDVLLLIEAVGDLFVLLQKRDNPEIEEYERMYLQDWEDVKAMANEYERLKKNENSV